MNRDRQSGLEPGSGGESCDENASSSTVARNRSASSEMAHQWFQTHGDDMFAFAMRRVGNRAVAEDLVQETFLALIQGVSRQDSIESPKGFLLSILKRKMADHFRRECRQSELSRQSESETLEHGSVERIEWPDPSQSMCEQEFKSALLGCVQRLPAPMRQAFELRVIRRFSVDEAAELLGVSKTVLASRLYRGRLAVRDCLNYLFP